ncbi:hypothetical protein LVO85_04020 [Ornithinimicrobium sp. EGI L100131]|nr:hypothetical protein [Ornithinimicrobium sediminis]MCE0486010.1 hypothetical protein [Ornithinimicrobium sediminis]
MVAGTEYDYAVVAVSAAGVLSAPGTVTVTVPADPVGTPVEFVAEGADWAWKFDNEAWLDDWTSVGFDDDLWALGPAPLGHGSSLVATDIMPESISPQPLSAQFRHTFEVQDPTTVVNGVVTTWADDGVVVFVNGVEVGRANMAPGTVDARSTATARPSTADAAADPVTFEVPSALLVEGENVVAASAHVGYRKSPDLSFELTFTAERTE